MKTWKPSTCGCAFEVGADYQTFISTLNKCPAHQHPDDKEGFDAARAENIAFNEAQAILEMEGFSGG